MSVTGTLLAFERQITLWADTGSYHVAPLSTQTSHLPVETLMSAVREKQLGAPTTLTLRADPGTPAAIGLSGGRTVFADPYTGEVLGEGSQKVRGFFRVITDWHRWLGMQGENRTIAKAITGACNLVFLFLVRKNLRRREGDPVAPEPKWLREIQRSTPIAELGPSHSTGNELTSARRQDRQRQAEELVKRNPDQVAMQVAQWMSE